MAAWGSHLQHKQLLQRIALQLMTSQEHAARLHLVPLEFITKLAEKKQIA